MLIYSTAGTRGKHINTVMKMQMKIISFKEHLEFRQKLPPSHEYGLNIHQSPGLEANWDAPWNVTYFCLIDNDNTK